MTCGCSCHFGYAPEVYGHAVLAVLGPHCNSCAEIASDHVPVTSDNIRALVTGVNITPEAHLNVLRYDITVRLDPVHQMMAIVVKVSQQLAQNAWLSAEEMAYGEAAAHLNRYWKQRPQSLWVQEQLTSYPQAGGHAIMVTKKPPEVTGTKVISDLQRWLPAMSEVVTCPGMTSVACDDCIERGLHCRHEPLVERPCHNEKTITDMVVHLNDVHQWERGAVADWLETLDVDLSFGAEPPPAPALPARGAWTVSDDFDKADGGVTWSQKALLDEIVHYNIQYKNLQNKISPKQFVHDVYLAAQKLDHWAAEEVDLKQHALDAKKTTAHTAFTVNPTKKSPHKK